MLKYIEVTGKSEEEAITNGLAQLGLTRDEVSVEILNRGKVGFLGIGSVPAKVKLTYEEGPDQSDTAQSSAVERREEQANDSTASGQNSQSVKKDSFAGQPADDEVSAAILKFQTGLFAHMGMKVAPIVTRKGDIYQVVLQGENMGALIGHHGETLDAIQQLTSYAVNRGHSHRVRIHVDAEGYRAKREESLGRLARKTAEKVVRYRRNITMEPMNAYERHVVHTALQDFPDVSTYSTGTEPNRRTVVVFDPKQ